MAEIKNQICRHLSNGLGDVEISAIAEAEGVDEAGLLGSFSGLWRWLLSNSLSSLKKGGNWALHWNQSKLEIQINPPKTSLLTALGLKTFQRNYFMVIFYTMEKGRAHACKKKIILKGKAKCRLHTTTRPVLGIWSKARYKKVTPAVKSEVCVIHSVTFHGDEASSSLLRLS